METLLYPEEHQSCHNYCMRKDANIRLLHYPQGTRQIVDTSNPIIIFMLEGEVLVTSDNYKEIHHTAGHISLQMHNSSSYIHVLKACTFISFHSPHDISLCDRFSLQQLPQYIPTAFKYQFTLLPIRPRLQEYLDYLRHCLEDGLGCIHFHELKMQELFLLLRVYYTKEELATFFYPLIGKNRDFKDFVYEHYLHVNNLSEFAALANTSIDTFKRRFKEAFGEPAYKWMTQRKAEHIYRDLTLTTKTIGEIAEEYRFSSIPYLTTFCKQHLGKTPQQLRNEAGKARDTHLH